MHINHCIGADRPFFKDLYNHVVPSEEVERSWCATVGPNSNRTMNAESDCSRLPKV